MSETLKTIQDQADFEVELAEKEHPGPKEFMHLHSHSLFSTLDGVATPEQYIERCTQLGMTHFALTDHGSLAGLPDAYFAAKKHKVQFAAGCELYLNDWHPKMQEFKKQQPDGKTKLKDLKEVDPEFVERYRRNRHITAICKNMTGYKNLVNLLYDGYSQGLYYNKPRTWMEQLAKYHEGLIILSGCMNGPICHELKVGSDHHDQGLNDWQSYYANAKKYVREFKEIFGDDFYLEVQMPGDAIPRAKQVFWQMCALAKSTGIKPVMTGDIHYLNRADFELQKVMMAIDQGTTVDSDTLFHADTDEGFFKSRAQFRKVFVGQEYNKYESINFFEQTCDNTIEIAGKCKPFEPDLSPKLPEIQGADEQIQKLVAQALIFKGLHKNDDKYLIDGRMVTYKEQAKIELDRIIEKRFSSYFLITRNLVHFARSSSYDVGPARGSAGGSLVCYLLGIHELDPLKWGLSFDRFLSPARGGFLLNVTME